MRAERTVMIRLHYFLRAALCRAFWQACVEAAIETLTSRGSVYFFSSFCSSSCTKCSFHHLPIALHALQCAWRDMHACI